MFVERGLASAYHRARAVDHGAEAQPTLRWVGRGGEVSWFHCDFVFVSPDLLEAGLRAEVGAADLWIGPGRSDHCPVVVHL